MDPHLRRLADTKRREGVPLPRVTLVLGATVIIGFIAADANHADAADKVLEATAPGEGLPDVVGLAAADADDRYATIVHAIMIVPPLQQMHPPGGALRVDLDSVDAWYLGIDVETDDIDATDTDEAQ